MPTIATPQLLKDPGYLFWAPLATAFPTNTVAASKFTDAWPVTWIGLGATEEGSTFAGEQSVEAVTVAELFDPVAYDVTSTSTSLAFALASWTLNNLRRAFNGGAITLVSGTGATALNSYEPPDPAAITRCMIGWESLDATVRLIGRQCLNGGTVESAFQRSPNKALIPFELNFERPVGARPWTVFTAGLARVGD